MPFGQEPQYYLMDSEHQKQIGHLVSIVFIPDFFADYAVHKYPITKMIFRLSSMYIC